MLASQVGQAAPTPGGLYSKMTSCRTFHWLRVDVCDERRKRETGTSEYTRFPGALFAIWHASHSSSPSGCGTCLCFGTLRVHYSDQIRDVMIEAFMVSPSNSRQTLDHCSFHSSIMLSFDSVYLRYCRRHSIHHEWASLILDFVCWRWKSILANLIALTL